MSVDQVGADEPEADTAPGSPVRSGWADRLGSLGELLGLYVACIVGALVLSALLVESTGGSWSEVFSALLDGSLRKPGRVGGNTKIAE